MYDNQEALELNSELFVRDEATNRKATRYRFLELRRKFRFPPNMAGLKS
jgi:hypothetical protein